MTHRAHGLVEVPRPIGVVARDHAVLDTVLDDILTQVDNRVAIVDNHINEALELPSMVEAGEKRQDDLIVTHVSAAKDVQELGVRREKVDGRGRAARGKVCNGLALAGKAPPTLIEHARDLEQARVKCLLLRYLLQHNGGVRCS